MTDDTKAGVEAATAALTDPVALDKAVAESIATAAPTNPLELAVQRIESRVGAIESHIGTEISPLLADLQPLLSKAAPVLETAFPGLSTVETAFNGLLAALQAHFGMHRVPNMPAPIAPPVTQSSVLPGA